MFLYQNTVWVREHALKNLHRSIRGGKGIKCYKITEKTGNVVSVKAVNEENEIMLITTEGIIIQMRVDEISVLGRITSGVKLIDLDPDKDIVVATMAKVRDSQPSDAKDSFLEEMENEMRQNEEEADNDIEETDDTDNPQE